MKLATLSIVSMIIVSSNHTRGMNDNYVPWDPEFQSNPMTNIRRQGAYRLPVRPSNPIEYFKQLDSDMKAQVTILEICGRALRTASTVAYLDSAYKFITNIPEFTNPAQIKFSELYIARLVHLQPRDYSAHYQRLLLELESRQPTHGKIDTSLNDLD